jgi:hypothetical protein
MSIDNLDDIPFAFSTLKVVASESVDVSKDLESTESKSVSELFNEKKEEQKKEKK